MLVSLLAGTDCHYGCYIWSSELRVGDGAGTWLGVAVCGGVGEIQSRAEPGFQESHCLPGPALYGTQSQAFSKQPRFGNDSGGEGD